MLAIVFLMTGSCSPPLVASTIGFAPFQIDVALRAFAAGWYPSDRTIPVAIIDIDERTHQQWGRPPETPRADLARLIGAAAAANPKAVVVDVDLSWGSRTTVDSGAVALRRFLEGYRGTAPLVFVKRMLKDSLTRLVPATSDLDDLIGMRPKLVWAHAYFTRKAGGAVRDWDAWIDVCVGDVARALPSVALVVVGGTDSLVRAGHPSPGGCGRSAPPRTHRLLLGPRMTDSARVERPQVRYVAARTLLNSAFDRDDSSLFEKRIVVIGATHADANDHWLTPRGYVPGMELIASTMHFYPLLPRDGIAATVRLRITTVVVFLGLALVTWWFVGVAMVGTVIVLLLFATGVAVGLFEAVWFFDAAAAALVLIVCYEAARAAVEFVVRIHDGWARRKPATIDPTETVRQKWKSRARRFWTAFVAASLKDPPDKVPG